MKCNFFNLNLNFIGLVKMTGIYFNKCTDIYKEKQFTPASRSVRKTRLNPELFQSLIPSHATTVLTNRNTENHCEIS